MPTSQNNASSIDSASTPLVALIPSSSSSLFPSKPPKINVLPNEIFGIIFEHLRSQRKAQPVEPGNWPEGELRHAPFHIANEVPFAVLWVCSRWREAAKANPHLWTRIKVALASYHNSRDPAISVHNQPMIDMLAMFSGDAPVTLCFGQNSKASYDVETTELNIGALFNRVESVLIDLSCDRLVCALKRICFPKLKRIHVGESAVWSRPGVFTNGLDLHVHYLTMSKFWAPDAGVEEVVWTSSIDRMLECPLDWGRLVILTISTDIWDVCEYDAATLLIDCPKLRSLTLPLAQSTASWGRLNRGQLIDGPLPDTIENRSLEVLRFRHNCHGTTDYPLLPVKMLPGLVTSSLKKVVVQHQGYPTLNQLHFLTNVSTVRNVESLQLDARTINPQDLGVILTAMPELRELTMGPWAETVVWSSFRGLGIDVETLEVIGNSTSKLESLTVFGESWLPSPAVERLRELFFLEIEVMTDGGAQSRPVDSCPTIRTLSIEIWGGVSPSQCQAVRESCKPVDIACAVVGSCPLNPTTPPRTIDITPFAYNADPSDDFTSISDPRLPPEPADAVSPEPEDGYQRAIPRICELCRHRHTGHLVGAVRWKLLSKFPDEYAIVRE